MASSRFKFRGKRFLHLSCLLLAVLFLSGCVTLTDLETSQENTADIVATVNESVTLRQDFVMRRPRLNSITLWVAPDPKQPAPGSGIRLMNIRLYQAPQDTTPLLNTQISIVNNGSIRVDVPVKPGPAGQTYTLVLKSKGGGIQILGRKGDPFVDGQAYLDNQPLPGDIAFHTTYDYDTRAVLADLESALPDSWLAFPLVLTLLLPGWLIFDFSGLRKKFDTGEQLALSTGLSLAAIPLVMLWTTTLKIHWTQAGVLLVAGLLTAVWLWRITHQSFQINIGWPGISLLAIFLFSLAVRFIMTRDLSAPDWVDSVHHALITRLISLSGTFPQSYAPYLNLVPTEYHAGFHSGLATFLWLSGLQIPKGMLLYGQVLNALAVPAVYLLAVSLTENRTAGVIAALTTGLITPMPAYYTSWGRYTQLAGLLLLPVAFTFIKGYIQQGKFGLLAILACAGLLLTHYRVVVFLACLVLAYLISQTHWNAQENRTLLRKTLFLVILVGVGSLLVTLPWTGRNIAQLLIPALNMNSGRVKLFSDFSWRFLTTGLGNYATGLSVIGLVVGLLFRKRFAVAIGLWVVFLLFAANLSALNLPGGWLMNNLSVEISLFMPISVLTGYLVSQVITSIGDILPPPFIKPARWALLPLGIILAGFAAQQILPILNPATQLFHKGDLAAISWLNDNIPQDAVVLINPFLWGYNIYAGNDGGYWIAPLTGRNTIPPPVIYGFGDRETYDKVNKLCQQVLADGSHPEDLWAFLKSKGIRYIFTGVRGGVISPFQLQNSPHFQPIYSQQGASIYSVLP
ncbi:MAG: hypothetical protein ACM3PY_13025 [Omnitrophica WOR_2 bacterium]